MLKIQRSVNLRWKFVYKIGSRSSSASLDKLRDQPLSGQGLAVERKFKKNEVVKWNKFKQPTMKTF